jgi:hypothetical protein
VVGSANNLVGNGDFVKGNNNVLTNRINTRFLV